MIKMEKNLKRKLNPRRIRKMDKEHRKFIVNLMIIINLIFTLLYPINYQHRKSLNRQKGRVIQTENIYDLDIDPDLEDLINDPDQQKRIIHLLAKLKPNAYESFLSHIQRIPDLQIERFFREFSMVRLKGKVSEIHSILDSPFLEGLYMDSSHKIEIKNSSPSKLHLSNPIEYTNASDIIESEGIPQKLGSNKSDNGKDTIIAILDSGIDIPGQIGGELDDLDDNSSTLDPKIYGSVSMVPYEPLYYSDFKGSGTFHAGVAAGTSGRNKTFQGIAPQSFLLNVKVVDSFGLTYSSFVISGIEWAIQHDADVICLPWTFPGFYNDPISIAINEAVKEGFAVVTPAGDDGPSYTSVLTPGQSLGAITVGSYDPNKNKVSNFSGRGPTYDLRTTPDVIAPGVNIVGPRAQDIVDYSGLNTSLFSESDLTIPDFNVDVPDFGTPINENFTSVSSTTAATAIVSGACAILISLFPLATPQLIKISLMKTAVPLYENTQDQGRGLINVTAAALWLNQYFSLNYSLRTRVPRPSIYPGAISNQDYRDLCQEPEYTNWSCYNIYAPMSTQVTMPVMFINDNTTLNLTQMDIHLPLNQFAVSYNKTGYLFSELTVYKELESITPYSGYDAADYARWGGIIGLNRELFITVILETWAYTFNGTTGDQPNYNDRVTGFKFTFNFLNYGEKIYKNFTLHSFFKSDLYLNEKNITDPYNLDKIQNATYDDEIHYDPDNKLIYALDSIEKEQNSNKEYTSFCFNSTSHPLDRWEINRSSVLFSSLFQKKYDWSNKNESNTANNSIDLGFVQSWHLDSFFKPNEHLNFSGIFSVGKGNTTTESLTRMIKAIEIIKTNVTHPLVKDMAVIQGNSKRVSKLGETVKVDAYIINMGNIKINSTEFWFIANLSSQTGEINLFSSINSINNWKPMDMLHFEVEWTPLQEGVIIFSFLVGGSSLLSIPDDALQNNYIVRTHIIYNSSILKSHLSEMILITPDYFPQKPFILQNPGDIAALNVTIISPVTLNDLRIEFNPKYQSISQTTFQSIDQTSYHHKIPLIFIVPMFYQKGFYLENIDFLINNGDICLTLPVQFKIEDTKGRIMFDGIHNEITQGINPQNISLSGLSFNILQERMDYIFGDFYSFRESFSSIQPLGMSMMQIIPNLNLSDILRSQIEIGTFSEGLAADVEEDYSFALNYIFKGENFFTFSENLTTDYYTYDLVKFFDSLVICDPEKPFTPSEISNLTKYIELGGNLIVFAENASENALSSINNLISSSNLMFSNQTDGNINLNLSYQNYDYNLSLQAPMNIIKKNISKSAGIRLNDYIGYSQIQKGHILLIGDEDIITEQYINQYENKKFVTDFILSLTNQTLDLGYDLSKSTVKKGEKTYLSINLQNSNQSELIQKDFLSLMGFVDETGQRINPQLFGYELPVMPLLKTNSTAFYGYFDSEWAPAGTSSINIVLYLDTPSTLAETISFNLTIIPADLKDGFERYKPRTSPYEQLFDILFLGLFLLSLAIIWAYSAEKWKLRHRYVEIDEKKKNLVENYFSSLHSELEKLTKAINSKKLDNLQKIRYLLRQKDEVQNQIDKIKKIATELGEK